MTSPTPVARADVVGSLLRPAYLRATRQEVRDGTGSLDDLHSAEDRAIREAITLQQEAGVDVITDGELRRATWIASMPAPGNPAWQGPLGGFAFVEGGGNLWMQMWRNNAGEKVPWPARPQAYVTEPLRVERDIVADEYGFLAVNAAGRTKFCFPAPSYHRSIWHPRHSAAIYPTVDAWLTAVKDYIREHVVQRAIALGCDYLQMDAPNYGQTYVDPDVRAMFEAEGHDLQADLIADAEIDNAVFEGVTGVTRAIHICRGNGSGGIWSAAGGYERLAAEMYPRLTNYDNLLLEYDTPRAGDFSPLRYLLPHHVAVLGLITTKVPELEAAEDIARRVDAAAQYAPLDRLALSPQCGFNSGEAGNPLTIDQQAAKLRLVASVARRVWG